MSGRWLVNSKVPSMEIVFEVLDHPKHALHLKQERRVVLLIGSELPAGISDGEVVAVGVNLGQNCAQPSRTDFVPNCGVGCQSVLESFSRICHDWFRNQGMLKSSKRLQGLLRERSCLPGAVLLGEFREG